MIPTHMEKVLALPFTQLFILYTFFFFLLFLHIKCWSNTYVYMHKKEGGGGEEMEIMYCQSQLYQYPLYQNMRKNGKILFKR